MKKLSFYRPAIAGFLAMLTMSLHSTGLGFLVAPVSDALGVGRGSLTLYMSLMTLANAFSSPIMGKLAGKKGVRPLLVFSGIWACLAFWGFSFSRQLWMFYLISILAGPGMSGCLMLSANVLLQKSYDAKTSAGLLGIVMAGSGVGGVLVSMAFPALLEATNWQTGYRALGLCWLVLCALSLLIMGKETAPVVTDEPAAAVASKGKAAGGKRSPLLLLLIVEMVFLAAACAINQNLPSVLNGLKFDTAQQSVMMSVVTAVLAIGKIAQGVLYQKTGARVGGGITIAIFALGLVLLSTRETAMFALPFCAIGLGVYTTLMPIVTRRVVGAEQFAATWGILQAIASVSIAVAIPLWGLVFDTCGSYAPVLIAHAVLLAISLAANFLLTRPVKD